MEIRTDNKYSLAELVFTITVVIFPITAMYGVGSSNNFTLSDLILVINIPICLFHMVLRRTKLQLFTPLLPHVLYVVVSFLFISMSGNIDFVSMGLRTGRYITYLIIVILFSKYFFNFKSGLKYARFVTLFVTFYLFLQHLLFVFFGIYLQGYIHVSFLSVLREDLFLQSSIAMSSNFVRMRSVFVEPASYAQYVLLYLGISLFYKQDEIKHPIMEAIIITFGLVICASSTGILCAGFIWFIWFLNRLSRRLTFERIFSFLVVGTLFITLLSFSNQLAGFLIRMENGGSTHARFDGYNYVLNDIKTSYMNAIFGRGMQTTASVYLAAYPRMLYYWGYVGLAIYVFSILYIVSKTKGINRMLLILFHVIAIGTEINLGFAILHFWPFIICGNKEEVPSRPEMEKELLQSGHIEERGMPDGIL